MNRLTESPPATRRETCTALRILISGRVQGVGFRPVIARLAHELSLAGDVRNTNDGVEIIIEGLATSIDRFLRRLKDEPPHLATINDLEVAQVNASGRRGFEIRTAPADGAPRTGIPLDLAVCSDCLDEVKSPGSRRTEYPFTSCTDCGPRYSILSFLPYERSDTAMADFAMCRLCAEEYRQSTNRRFHAETIACPQCGPRCWLSGKSGQRIAKGPNAIAAARAALDAGEILALRGIGGYQLLVDATNAAAVARLRERKRRQAKPLAVLVHSLSQARELAVIDRVAERALGDPAGPIVIVPAKPNTSLAAQVCAGLAEVGIMLPTSPLHWLIARDGPPLVATSGNIEGCPLECEINSVTRVLSDVADMFLHHDRPILRPIDDSLTRIIGGKSVTLRAARGVAPLPLEIPAGRSAPGRSVLAVGGQQNSALAIWNGYQAVLGPHVGDLDEVGTCRRWHDQRRDLCAILDAKPSLIVHDLHPDYYSTRWALESSLPTIAVQHHHAHVAAAMCEHGWLDRKVLGVAWDGTGFGTDGTIWGGEFLKATATRFQRVARLRPFALPGGEAAIREPWRIAAAMLADTRGADAAISLFANRGWDRKKLEQLIRVADRPNGATKTSSIGRLFDAVAVIILPLDATSGGRALYEGQLAMLLESACQWPADDRTGSNDLTAYPFPVIEGEPDELDWRPLMDAIVTDYERGVLAASIARRFHTALVAAIGAIADRHFGLPVVLCGGVFQNRVLTEMTLRQFAGRRQPLGTPRIIPPGDGGLAAGQLIVALAQLDQNRPPFQN